MNYGNRNKARTPAQMANLEAQRRHFKPGRKPKEQPEPFGRTRSSGIIGPMMKTVDTDTRALIDAAIAERCEAS